MTPSEVGLTNGASTLVAARWWSVLGDQRLDRLVEQALQGHPGMAVAHARLRRAEALADMVRAGAGPQLALVGELGAQRYSAHGLGDGPAAGSLRTRGTLQAELSFSPDFVGGRAAELASALGQARAAEADAADAATALAARLGHAYVALARLLAQHGEVTRLLAQREEILALTRQRVAAGLDSRVELMQAEGALPDARAQREAVDEHITLARRQVAVLAGLAPDTLGHLSPRLEALHLRDMPATLGADLLGRRPDVVAARWRVEAALQDVTLARLQFYPDVNLAAFVGLHAVGLGKLLEAGSRQYGVTPALRLPLFDGGRLRAQLGGRRADLDDAIAHYNAAVFDAVKEAGDAMASERGLARQAQEQAQALASAETAHALARQRFGAGLANYLVVLQSESQLLVQRRLAVDLRARRLDNRVALLQALGGGWVDGSALAGMAPP